MSVTSDEVNYLIYRYLQESGFSHSSFTFGHESHILKNEFKNIKVSAGALISLLQKGLLYVEAEAHTNEDGTEKECSRPFSLLQAHECDKSPSKRNKERKEKREIEVTKTKKKKSTGGIRDEDKMEIDETENLIKRKAIKEISSADVLSLAGHQAEVFNCEWNPTKSLLASGSGDGTARIWKITTSPVTNRTEYEPAIELKHSEDNGTEQQKDITALTWNSQGSLLATGSYAGDAKIWTSEGELQHTLTKHKGPIFSLKWNKSGSLLLSSGVDHIINAWDPQTGQEKQQFECHSAPVLELDWMDDETFASCSTDKLIYVSRVGESKWLKRFQGHTHEVNAIKWCPRGTLLASCSDDKTAKIWRMDSESCVADLREHEKEICAISWSPTGPGSLNPNQDLVLATASYDNTIKLWNPETGKCISDLSKYHNQGVYTISFSPDGRYLASGSFDSRVNLWSVKDGSLVRSYKSAAGVYSVAWNQAGDKVSASLANNTISVFDFRL